jgi:tetratricopeptide (TPR) repeat protein
VGSLSQGDTPKAHALLLESQALSKELDDKRGIADTLVILAYIAFWRGEHERMRALLEEALTLHKAVGDRRGMALGLYGQGWLALSQGEYTLARSQFEESLTILMSLGHQWFAILCLEGLAATASAQGHLLHAARVWGAAAALRQRLRASAPPVLERTYERMVVKVRTQLGEEAFDTVWAQGQAMALQGSDLRRLGMEFAS